MEKYGEESHGFAYDVFLNFRGEDTRNNFTAHLLKKLQEEGIDTFFDDENLRIGDVLSPAFLKAIEDSKISIIVFSQKYATSKWCLAELEKIIECTEKSNIQQLGFPIFYYVDPSDVRNQRNSYGEAMIAHEERFGKDSEKIQAWRSVLSKAADLKGHHIQTGSEAKHIEEIVDKVSARIAPKPLHVGEDLVGLKHHIEEVKSLLDMKDDTRRMLGIYGLGGIGKTELAKVLYNEIVHQFEAASFLANVREKSMKNGLEHLQKTLLSEMFKPLKTELGSTYKGISEMIKKLQKTKVLLVLDDVDENKQLNELAGRSDWFGPGSRIIITTRDKNLLDGHRFQETSCYKMTELNDQHSLELFCRNAFEKCDPETGYEDVSYRAVSYAKGLPLALKVIGSNLAPEKSLEAWEDALKEYERTPHEDILKVLEISYNRLRHDAKSVFLDIACFFKGERIEYVKMILEEFGAISNIKELVNKSLLTIEQGCLNMHDLLQDMGREIVRQDAKYPGKRSRLWDFEDVLEVLIEDSGSDAIEGIILDPPQRKVVEWSGIAFKKMISLRILVVRNTSFTSEPAYLPNYIRLLDWEQYPSKSFPPEFHPRHIIVLNLTNSQLTLEEPFKKFSNLTVMNFSHNVSITAMPDVSEVEKLRELRLDNCKNLITVHESVGSRKYLAHLSASGCIKLENFLQRMFLPSLEVLDLNLCVKLEHFPDIVSNMNKPLKISMISTSIERLPNSVGNLTGLVSLEMPNSRKLKYLPSSLFTLPNVVAFKFGGCSKLGESFRRFLHDSPSEANGRSTLKTLHFGNSGLSDEDLDAILIGFPELEELIASDNNFVSLPACIKESAHLTNLDVSGCKKLQKIHECSKLRFLNVHRCEALEHISELPCTIQKVDARYCFYLSRETSDMLWDQVKKERCGLEIVMPRTEIPEWFDYSCKGGNPRFWARGKFPIVAVALVFERVIGRTRKSRRQLVELHLVINGKCIPRKGYYNFRIEGDHVLVCDLRLLFSEEEWLGLDAFLELEHEWNQVLVSYGAPSAVMLSHWGVFVYKQGTNMEEYVQFTCPDPKYSDIANIPTIVPTRDPMKDQMMTIEELALDQLLVGTLNEATENEDEDLVADRVGFVDWDWMTTVSGLVKEAQDALEGKALDDKNSPLAWILRTMKEADDEDEATSTNFDHKDGMKPSVDVGAASTSGQQPSSEVQGGDPEQQEIMTEIFLDGMGAGLREAQGSFPSLDIDTTMVAAFNRGNRARVSLPESELEKKIYMEGIINGLLEAKLSFPILDELDILNTVLSKRGHKVMFQTLDWTKVTVPSSDDALLEAFMMMKQESSESEANKSKLFCKLMEEHKALRKKFEELENETSAPNKEPPSSQNQYDELLEKLNTQFAEFISKKGHSLDGTDDDQAKESTISESKSALSSTKMLYTDIGREGCKGVGKSEKLAAVLKGRAEELGRLYDAGIEGFQNTQEIQDLMSAIYLNGLRDGLLEAQAILLALDIDTSTTPVFKEENEEHVTHEVAKDEHVTAEAENPGEHGSAVAANNENPHETDIPTPPGPEVDNPRDPSDSEILVSMDDFGYMFS